MSSELGFLTGESAVTYNEFAGPAPKYRAVESFTHDMGNFSILSPSLIKQQTPIGGTIDLSEPGKLSIHSTTPSRLPVSKAQIQPTSPSASIKCPEKPCFLSNTTFDCSESNYDTVKESVEKALTSLEDYDWSYFKDDCMWKCKFLQGSSLRELHVLCYWDSNAEDHLLEVKRVKGDGLSQSSSDFFTKLKSVVTNTAEDEMHAKRGKLRGPLPLPMLPLRSAAAAAAPSPMAPLPLPATGASGFPLPPLPLGGRGRLSLGAPPLMMMGGVNPTNLVTEEQFLKGIRPIYSMATDGLFEPRLEASKMLCDLALKEKKFLENKECFELCMKSLEKLLNDDFEDVKQFAVMAFALFAEIPFYQERLSSFVLDGLIQLINNCPRELPAYYSAQMRRKSAQGLSFLAKSNPMKIMEQLKNMGYQTERDWLDHCATVFDKKTREFAQQIAVCYN